MLSAWRELFCSATHQCGAWLSLDSWCHGLQIQKWAIHFQPWSHLTEKAKEPTVKSARLLKCILNHLEVRFLSTLMYKTPLCGGTSGCLFIEGLASRRSKKYLVWMTNHSTNIINPQSSKYFRFREPIRKVSIHLFLFLALIPFALCLQINHWRKSYRVLQIGKIT